MADHYTVDEECQAIVKAKGSKFICHLFPVNTLESWDGSFKKVQENHAKASHHCFAYRINDIEKSDDDGEPRGTAGKPILGQLQKHNLYQMGAVVVRYFGGTLLGTGGLIRAYRDCTAEAIALAKIIKINPTREVTIKFDYEVYPDLMRICKRLKLPIAKQDLSKDPTITLSLGSEELSNNLSKLKECLYATSVINYDMDRFDALVEIEQSDS